MIDINNRTKSAINSRLVRQAAEKFLRGRRKSGREVSIAFVGNQEIRRLNKRYRGIDKATDVLSFAGEGNFLGEIIIDYSLIKQQAKKFGHSVDYELIFILIHGLLHLVGYDDKTEAGRREMMKLGEEFMEKILKKNNYD